ncbi:hypothetical protein EJ076_34710 [Mesorhizobium sp. M7D.F.Ca.US.005.01.1.1]|nr:hypothetical protein EJ076_34710 [Mesorhizobium sp. M7D.F.Ca.US.005.01.1.1]
MATQRLCSILDCGKRHYGRGYCSKHLSRLVNHGDPMGGSTPKGATLRFLHEVVFPYAGDECQIWPYSRNGHGYGKMRYNGRFYAAHRIVCEHVHGPAPSPDYDTAHSCGRGRDGCVTPSHLRWATHKDNLADRHAHGTAQIGEKCYASKLTEREVLLIRASIGKVTQATLASQYNVSKWTISDIQTRRNWGWLESPTDGEGASGPRSAS